MNTEYEAPDFEVLEIDNEDIMSSGEHDNGYGDFGDFL